METKILDFREAYDLYRLVDPVFPSDYENVDVIVFLRQLIDNILRVDPKITRKIVHLLVGKYDFFEGSDMDTLVILFTGLEENKIIRLVEFFRVITNG